MKQLIKINSAGNRMNIPGFFILCLCLFASCSDKQTEYWIIDNLKEIGGHVVTVFGNPEVVDTDFGKAVKFDGDADMLLVDFNPIGNATEFTIEVIFKPDACFPENTAPGLYIFSLIND